MHRTKCYGCFITALEEHKHLSGSLTTAHIHYRCPLGAGTNPLQRPHSSQQVGLGPRDRRDVHLIQGAWPGHWVPERTSSGEKDGLLERGMQRGRSRERGREGGREVRGRRWRGRNTERNTERKHGGPGTRAEAERATGRAEEEAPLAGNPTDTQVTGGLL